ncbi:MAG: response regulator [Betaproteobacteria bacterium]|nr:response regulator [Betaproteobacteria bacterium]
MSDKKAAGATDDARILASLIGEAVGPRERFGANIVIANLLAGLLLAVGIHDRALPFLLAGWLALLFGLQTLRLLPVRLYWQAQPTSLADLRSWARRFNAISVASGSTWGLAGLLFYFPDSPQHQALLGVLLCGLAAGTVPALARLLPGMLGSATGILGFFILRLLWEGDRTHLVMAAMLAVYLVFVLNWGRNLNRLIVESLRQRFENADLVERLREQSEAALAAKRVAEEANVAKSRFLAAASHDLRQPMNALTLFAGVLANEQRPEEVRSLAGHIERSVVALGKLFNALLDISKLDAGVVQPVLADFRVEDLFRALRNDFEQLASAKGLRLHIRPTDAAVRTDPQLLERILRNLLANAVSYTPQGRIVVGCRRRGLRWRLYVADTGIGIPAMERERIFEEFHQVGNVERDREKGLGLGLAIVRRLAGLLALRVELRSREGHGTLFSIDLPGGSAPAAAPREQVAAETGSGFPGLHVLVVDDENDIRLAMTAVLERWGCDVLASESLAHARAAMATRDWVPHMAIADLRLRDGESGIAVLDALRAEAAGRLPALLITGDTSPERLQEIRESGYRFLHKPATAARLRALMRFELDSGRA